ncbi:uncharacterized protein METZ01_LOCUS389357 [marine metagenome]|uniref:Uncharacterized protein n=1 Tax=marine metagenome TaxID=408172 RepID=A0A382UQG5_9ZZZZ
MNLFLRFPVSLKISNCLLAGPVSLIVKDYQDEYDSIGISTARNHPHSESNAGK